MRKDELVGKICEWARTRLAAKATSKLTQFALGAVSGGIGRSLLESKVLPLAEACSDEGGNLRWEEMKASVQSGFAAAGSVPVLGGLISLDAEDAADFFAFAEGGCAQTAPSATAPQGQFPPRSL